VNPRGGGSADPAIAEHRRRRYEIIDEVAPIDGEVVLRKSAPSAFWGTPLVGHLTRHQVDTIIIAGEATSGCVRATAVDGKSSRYKVIVPEECVFDRDEASHAINLYDMEEKYADVIALDEVLSYLQSVVPKTAAAVG
jgi:nicotinamidase-related amidase